MTPEGFLLFCKISRVQTLFPNWMLMFRIYKGEQNVENAKLSADDYYKLMDGKSDECTDMKKNNRQLRKQCEEANFKF